MTNLLDLSKTTNLVIRYLIVGGIAFLIEMGALFVLHNVLKLSPVTSVAISFWVGFAVAFILQKMVTFKNYQKSAKALAKQLVFYSILVAWNYIFSLAVVALLSPRFSVFTIRTCTILIVICWNFLIYKFIFKHS